MIKEKQGSRQVAAPKEQAGLTEEVRADSLDFLSLLVNVHEPLDTQRHSLVIPKVTGGAAGNGVQTQLLGLSLGINTWRHHSN